jgi:hypothetical protein
VSLRPEFFKVTALRSLTYPIDFEVGRSFREAQVELNACACQSVWKTTVATGDYRIESWQEEAAPEDTKIA